MPVLDFNSIPGYAEAAERESKIRDASFLEVTEDICGIEVMPLTPRLLMILRIAKTPFIFGGELGAVQIVQFLWIISPEFRGRRSAVDSYRRWRFVKRCRKLCRNNKTTWKAIIDGIVSYLEDAFQDAPTAFGDRRSDWSWCAAMTDLFAVAYGWTENDIASKPLKRLYQLRRIIKARDNPGEVIFNPRDRVVGEYLKKLNGSN